MGTGLPVVGSKIGENINIVQNRENGYLASSKDEWFYFLKLLINNHQLRSDLGKKGREIVKEKFSIQCTKKTFISFFKNNLAR